MWQRFDERARKVVFYAQEEAMRLNHVWIAGEHLLLGLVRESDSRAGKVLGQLGASGERICAEVERHVKKEESRTGGDMTLTPEAKRVVDLAYDEARNLNNNFIGTEHLMLGLIRLDAGVPQKVFKKLKVKLRAARKAVAALHEAEGVKPEPPSPPVDSGPPLTERANAAIVRIREAARSVGEGDVSTEHLLLGLVGDGESTSAKILDRLGVTEPALRAEIERRSATYKGNLWQVKVLPRVQRVIDLAKEIAEVESAEAVGTSHYLLAIVREEDGIGAKALRKLGVDEAKVLEAREALRTQATDTNHNP